MSDPPGSHRAGREAHAAYVEERRLRLTAEAALERAERERDAMVRELELRDQESLAAEARAQKAEGVVEAARRLHNEVDCRIEHGAESGGHLDYVRGKLAAALTAYDEPPTKKSSDA